MLVAWGGPCRSGLSRKDPILPSTIAAPAGAWMVAGMLFLTSYGGDDEPVRGICELLAPGAVVSDGRWQALPCPFFGLSVFGHGGKKHGYAFCRVDALISPAAGNLHSRGSFFVRAVRARGGVPAEPPWLGGVLLPLVGSRKARASGGCLGAKRR